MIRDKLYGEFTADERADFNSLLLELQKLNGGPVPRRKTVSLSKIKSLPPAKNERLWRYMLHGIKLFLMLPNRRMQLKGLSDNNPYNDKESFIEQLQLDLAPFVYSYMWRRYHATEKPEGYIITTARFAWITFLTTRGNEAAVVPLDNLGEAVTKLAPGVFGLQKSDKVNNISPR